MPIQKNNLSFYLAIFFFCTISLAVHSKTASKIKKHSIWWESNTTGPAKKHLPDFIRITQKVNPAIVNIFTTSPSPDFKDSPKALDEGSILDKFFEPSPGASQRLNLGSGFIINEEGYVLTNAHLVDKSRSISIFQGENNHEYKAGIIGIDSSSDIALLKIKATTAKFPYLLLGNSGDVNVGEWIMAVGNPFGFTNTVTQGIVSAKGREFDSLLVKRRFGHFIQTDASINPGNSGGPLINYRGEVIGINTALSTSSLGIGFAIPINTAKSILPELKKNGRVIRGYLGIVTQDLNPVLSGGLGLSSKSGALVVDVVEKSPAFNAEIKVKDVIVKFRDRTIPNAKDMYDLIETTPPGKPFKLILVRKGKTLEKMITLIEIKDDTELPREDKKTADLDLLGLLVEDTLPYGSGITVNDIDPNGLASRGGVLLEDIIFDISIKNASGQIESFKIKNSKEYEKLLKKITAGNIVTFLINRFGSPVYVAFKFDSK